jgi:hypothetical protein
MRRVREVGNGAMGNGTPHSGRRKFASSPTAGELLCIAPAIIRWRFCSATSCHKICASSGAWGGGVRSASSDSPVAPLLHDTKKHGAVGEATVLKVE